MSTPRTVGLFAIVVAALAGANVASAGVITVSKVIGTVQQTSMVDAFLVNANELAGMTVEAFFSDGTSETAIWADTGATTGGASGTGWSMSGTGNALDAVTLTNNRTAFLIGFLMDGGTGDGVFDTGVADFTGTRTPNTNIGNTVAITGVPTGFDFDLDVTYFDAVRVTPNPPNGDIFRRLRVDISDVATGAGLGSEQTLGWRTDMDALAISGDIQPAPAPGTLLLLTLGLGGLAMRRRYGSS